MPPGRLSPGLHIPWKVVYYVRWLLTRDSRERRGLLRLLWFNYLFWRPAFECRSLRLSEFLRRLFDLLLSRTKNDHMLGGKEQTKHLESITKKEKKKKKLDYPVSQIAVVETLKIFFFLDVLQPWPPMTSLYNTVLSLGYFLSKLSLCTIVLNMPLKRVADNRRCRDPPCKSVFNY